MFFLLITSSIMITFGAEIQLEKRNNYDGFQKAVNIEEKLENNPICKKYNENISKLTNTDEIQREQNKYYNAWMYDIEQTNQVMNTYLTENDRKLFSNYCQAWWEYQEEKYKWEQSQYYNDGSINKILVTDYRAEEAKMFAFNLKRYLYTYTESIVFFNNGYIDE